jgi:O-succinylbenzoate synthase
MYISIEKHILQFIKPAKTSRGEYAEKPAYLLWIKDGNISVCGEASPLHDLSIDGKVDLLEIVKTFENQKLTAQDLLEILDSWKAYPSLRFALFCCLEKLKVQGENKNIWVNNAFTSGLEGIKINGLVWMNDVDSMYQEAIEKIHAGFTCIKIKVGALDFDAECRLIEKIRKQFNAFKIELRLDANGGFSTEDALFQIKELSRFEIHSLEQPIKAYQPEMMGEICAKSKIDIALDEELIGVNLDHAAALLSMISPKYIIVKPTLFGGFDICDQWITEASKQNIGWWSTSALEGNIGLSDIAQWVSTYKLSMPQGLGTGSLFVKNFPAKTKTVEEHLFYIS